MSLLRKKRLLRHLLMLNRTFHMACLHSAEICTTRTQKYCSYKQAWKRKKKISFYFLVKLIKQQPSQNYKFKIFRNNKNWYIYAKSYCSAIYCLKRQTEAMKAKKRGINKNVSKEFLVTLWNICCFLSVWNPSSLLKKEEIYLIDTIQDFFCKLGMKRHMQL